jgi:DNA-binding Xre family transcriptional regulator
MVGMDGIRQPIKICSALNVDIGDIMELIPAVENQE